MSLLRRNGRPRAVPVHHGRVRHTWVRGRTMEADACPPLLAPFQRGPRTLDARLIRRTLRSAPLIRTDTLAQLVFDHSASVTGGNDVVGLRQELALIAVEHLAAARSKGKWYLWVASFDCSDFNLPITRLDRRGLESARKVLLTVSPGSSSVLGPSLRRAEAAAAEFGGRNRLLVVLSDFELYDPDPVGVLDELEQSRATEVLAMSLNHDPPSRLVGTRVRGARVLATDPPADLANHIVDAARACVVPERRSS